jgi:hypothetical protein
MKTLKLSKPWPSGKGLMQPGDYRIPADINLTLARCARADGAGEIVEAASFRKPAKPSRKAPAPENKADGPAPENKSEVGQLRGRRKRAESDSASGGEDPGI